MYTRLRCSPQGQNNTVGQKHSNIYSEAQHGNVPGRRADGIDWPFPSKPVRHRRHLNPRTQGSLDLYDFEKITISKQTTGPLSSQEQHSDDIKEIHGSHHPRKDSRRLPIGEMQMARAIHEKELMLQEKLWKVEEKIRQKIQMDSVGADAGDDQKSEEENHNRGEAEREKAQTKPRLSEQHRRKPVKSRETLMQETRQDDAKYLRKKQSQMGEDKRRNRHEEEGSRWKKKEIEFAESPQSKMNHDITVNKQKVSAEVDKLRWQNVKAHTREQGNVKDHLNWGGAGVRPQDGIEKAKERELNMTSTGNIGWTRENKYRERTSKEMYNSDNKQDLPQMSQYKTVHRLATENLRDEERKIFEESSLPPVSTPYYSSRPQQGELGLMDSVDASFQLFSCRICNRKFASGRLEKHVQICKKVSQSHRRVFNSYNNRTKGSAIEEFWKTHSRSKTPEVLQKNQRPNHKAYTKNLHHGRLPATISK